MDMKLKDSTDWRPEQGVAQLGAQQPVAAQLVENRYGFELPPQIEPGQLHVKIGDASQSVRVEPTLRPELTSIVASVALPAYLGIPERRRPRTCGAGRSRWCRGARRRSPRPSAAT